MKILFEIHLQNKFFLHKLHLQYRQSRIEMIICNPINEFHLTIFQDSYGNPIQNE